MLKALSLLDYSYRKPNNEIICLHHCLLLLHFNILLLCLCYREHQPSGMYASRLSGMNSCQLDILIMSYICIPCCESRTGFLYRTSKSCLDFAWFLTIHVFCIQMFHLISNQGTYYVFNDIFRLNYAWGMWCQGGIWTIITSQKETDGSLGVSWF